MKIKDVLWASCALVAMIAPANAAENWTTDFPAAMAQAATENKAVLIDFNGSDWCGPCMTLKSKVLATPAFADYAKDKLILVDVDMPQGDSISAEQKKINRALVDQFAVQAYPTILVLSKDGVVLGGFVGGTDQIDKVKADIDAALANAPAIDSAMLKAASLSGVDKAQALMAVYNMAPPKMRNQNAALKELIKACDVDDSTGLLAMEKAREAKLADTIAFRNFVKNIPRDSFLETLIKESERKDVSEYYNFLVMRVVLNKKMWACTSLEELQSFKAEMQTFAATSEDAKAYVDAALEGIADMGEEKLIERARALKGTLQN